MAEKMEEQLAQGTDASLLHNQMAVYAQTISDKDYEKMQEEGFSPMHMEAHTIVTVTDRIKVAMAKGGADISRMGGISDAKLEAVTVRDKKSSWNMRWKIPIFRWRRIRLRQDRSQ